MNIILTKLVSLVLAPVLLVTGFLGITPSNREANLGAAIPTAVALMETSLANSITADATSMTLVSATTKDGTTLATSTYGFIIDEGTSNEELVLATCVSTSCTAMTRGISVITGNTSITALKKAHRRGASVKITDAPQLLILSRIMNGDETIPNIIKYNSNPTFTASTSLVDKNYSDTQLASAVASATTTINTEVVHKALTEIITGLKTFTATTTLASTTINGNATIAGTLGVTGVATFTALPTIPVLPLANGDAASKKYVDDVVTSIGAISSIGSSTDNAIVRWDGTNASSLQNNSGWTISDGGRLQYSGVATTTGQPNVVFIEGGYVDPTDGKLYLSGLLNETATAADRYFEFTSGDASDYRSLRLRGDNVGIFDKVSSVGAILEASGISATSKTFTFPNISGEIALAVNPVVKTYLTADSPATWTKPAGLKYVIVEVQAAGGGGQGLLTDADGGMAGGGGGGYSKKLIAAASLGATETVTIGAGGGGSSSQDVAGTTGGSSSFGTHATATGGAGGLNNGGGGGIGSSGDLNVKGGGGGAGKTTGGYVSGIGGSSVLGGGAKGMTEAVANTNGDTGGVYGGGGSGAARNGSGAPLTGGTGGAGIVIVTEYFN